MAFKKGETLNPAKVDPAVLARRHKRDGVPLEDLAREYGYKDRSSAHKALTKFRKSRPGDYAAAVGIVKRGDPVEVVHAAAVAAIVAGRPVHAIALALGFEHATSLTQTVGLARSAIRELGLLEKAQADVDAGMPIGEARIRHRIGTNTPLVADRFGSRLSGRRGSVSATRVLDALQPGALVALPADLMLQAFGAPGVQALDGVRYVPLRPEREGALLAWAEEDANAVRRVALEHRAQRLREEAAALEAEIAAM